ncbi:MAG: 2OG-Fe(II) oxygenase family protein [Gammaproteobacteria bacterium]|jgi:uncharacterized protein (TIGR02466 family)|nr:MAG: hypothetical protein AMJ59_26780 [Gammaproteobacteria bacterium SG8_31]
MKIEKSGVLKLFPTYVWATQLARQTYEPINRDIQSRLDLIRRQRRDLDRSGQWQTEQDLHLHPELAGLVEVILSTARGICDSLTIEYGDLAITGCWANVSQKGFAHRQHIHPNNYLSGAYYVATAPGSDAITFHDPRVQLGVMIPPARNQDLSNPDQVTLDVREGMLVMFPAWLQHSVPPNLSDATRISVAFNVMFPDFGTRMASPLWKGDTPT